MGLSGLSLPLHSLEKHPFPCFLRRFYDLTNQSLRNAEMDPLPWLHSIIYFLGAAGHCLIVTVVKHQHNCIFKN